MILKRIKLNNFRNFTLADLELSSLTLLLGNNAQGKSNLLEAVYFLATTRSLRVEKEIQLIRREESFCRVEGEVVEDEPSVVGRGLKNSESKQSTKLEIAMQVRPESNFLEKRIKVNGVARRVGDYIGNLVVVYFSPEDINLVTGAPSLRRAYVDLSLAQTDRDYKKSLLLYAAALSSRNRLLKRIKEGLAKQEELDYWSSQLVGAGVVISGKREEFFREINQGLLALNKKQQLGSFSLTYQGNCISAQRLEEYLPREIAAGTSLIGPHRDDFTFQLNGQPLAFFGSRGEQRTAVLELKIAELRFISTRKEMPVLLLDDVFSELDENHRRRIIGLVSDQQTIISAVEGEKLPPELIKLARVIRVEQGTITP